MPKARVSVPKIPTTTRTTTPARASCARNRAVGRSAESRDLGRATHDAPGSGVAAMVSLAGAEPT